MVFHQRRDSAGHLPHQSGWAPGDRRGHHKLPHAGGSRYGEIRACSGDTDIFIYPGFSFRVLDGLITNFHLPESTLIMLVSAFYGYERTMLAYAAAVKENYRFFSFGDAMMIL